MITPKEILGHVSGGRVLDVATGSGGFIHFLLEGLLDYTEIIGIDTNQRGTTAFAEAFQDHPDIHFAAMDALHISFDPASFDMVCISNSLHHFEDPLVVLDQMKRMLRPGGTFVIAEMYRDGQTETQMTHVHLHHWWAAVDTVNGILHRETYRREQLVELAGSLGLADLRFYDLMDTEEDPKKADNLTSLEPVFDRYIQRAEGHPDLQARGEHLRQRVQEIGFHGATSLIIIGKYH
jgi:SAM-dependent methyltransferase